MNFLRSPSSSSFVFFVIFFILGSRALPANAFSSQQLSQSRSQQQSVSHKHFRSSSSSYSRDELPSPSKSIIENLAAIKETTVLSRLLNHTSFQNENAVQLLKQCNPEKPLTFFAPSNDALKKYCELISRKSNQSSFSPSPSPIERDYEIQIRDCLLAHHDDDDDDDHDDFLEAYGYVVDDNDDDDDDDDHDDDDKKRGEKGTKSNSTNTTISSTRTMIDSFSLRRMNNLLAYSIIQGKHKSSNLAVFNLLQTTFINFAQTQTQTQTQTGNENENENESEESRKRNRNRNRNRQRLLVFNERPGLADSQGLTLMSNSSYSNVSSSVIFPNPDRTIRGGRMSASVVFPDVPASCGFIHIIDKVLLPPLNITTTLRRAGLHFSRKLLYAHHGRIDKEIAVKVNEIRNSTFFIPINEAFLKRGGYNSTLKQLNEEKVKNFIRAVAASSSSEKTRSSSLAQATQRHTQSTNNKGVGVLGNVNDQDKQKQKQQQRQQNQDDDDDDEKFRQLLWNLTRGEIVDGILSTEDLMILSASSKNLTSLLGLNISLLLNKTTGELSLLDALGSGVSSIIFGNIPVLGGLLHIVTDFVVPFENKTASTAATAATPPTTTNDLTKAQTSVCLNNQGLSGVISEYSRNSSFILPLSAPQSNLPNCPTSDKLCYVAKLSSSCATSSASSSTTSNANADAAQIVVQPTCYNPNTHVCSLNMTLCPHSHPLVCGEHCYSASEYTCITSFALCPSHHPLRCGEACYSLNEYNCVNGQLSQK